MFFKLIKEINRLRKEINRLRKEINTLLSKIMSNNYWKVTIDKKNWRSQNFKFLGLNNLSPSYCWGAPTYKDIIEF